MSTGAVLTLQPDSGFTIQQTDKRLLIYGTIPVDKFVAIGQMNDANWIVPFGIQTALGATFAACHRDELPVWEAEVDQAAALKASRLADDDESVAELTWLFGRDTGLSSRTIFCVLSSKDLYRELTHVRLGGRGHLPSDPDDFGRCHRLLERFPAWRERLPEVAGCFPEWEPLVQNWDRLTALYVEELPTGKCPQLYDELQALTRG